MKLTHIDDHGSAKMVDVSEKPKTERIAVAAGRVLVTPETFALIRENRIKKGDVLATARIAAVMAAKKTPELIPLAHPIPISEVSADFELDEEHYAVDITVTARAVWRTGVEMEAIVGVVTAAATIYDMVKAVDRTAVITDVRLLEKSGGKSGTFIREENRP
ncbi:MAG: cyclic pyranopterin monophosphate synthase MoaC [Deltaproteobacteria bacterium]|nr:cyclic pyranopterin monophosphate synthase MoaC [Candidatus Zymogenaceae bacterium]